MRKPYFLTLLAAVLLISCTDALQNDVQSPASVKDIVETPSYVIPIEQALENLEEVLVDVNKHREESGLARLSLANRTECIAVDYRSLMTQNMKRFLVSKQPLVKDTALYIVNFPQESGYAILAADKRLDADVLVVADRGNLTLEELSQHYTLEEVCDVEGSNIIKDSIGYLNVEDDDYYVGGADPKFTNQLLKNYTKITIGTTPPIVYPPVDTYSEYSAWKNDATSSVAPLVKVAWHQGSPYNDNCPTCGACHNKKPAGCVSIAVTQILSANKKPTTLDEVYINWDSNSVNNISYPKTATDSVNIAKWVRFVGKKCCTFYGSLCWGKNPEKDYGFATPVAAKNFFKNYAGYKNVQKLSEYNETAIKNMLKDYKPVFITAFAAPFQAHAWVIDGYLVQKRTVTTKRKSDHSTISTSEQSREFIHCNFGWGNNSYYNGYYVSKVFNVSKGAVNTNSNNTSQSENADDKVYNYNWRIITYDLK